MIKKACCGKQQLPISLMLNLMYFLQSSKKGLLKYPVMPCQHRILHDYSNSAFIETGSHHCAHLDTTSASTELMSCCELTIIQIFLNCHYTTSTGLMSLWKWLLTSFHHNLIHQEITFLKAFEQCNILPIIGLKQLQNYLPGLLCY